MWAGGSWRGAHIENTPLSSATDQVRLISGIPGRRLLTGGEGWGGGGESVGLGMHVSQ